MSIIGINVNTRGTNLNDGISDEWNDSLLTVPINRVLSTDVNQKIVGTVKSISSIPDSLVLRDSFGNVTLTVTTPVADGDVTNKLYVDTEDAAIQVLAESAKSIAETATMLANDAQLAADGAQSTADDAYTLAALGKSIAETATMLANDAQADVDALSTQVNASKIYRFFVANNITGTLPADHTGSANSQEAIMLNSANLVYYNDFLSGIVYDPDNHWVADANKYPEYFGPSGVRYKISYGLTISAAALADRVVRCRLAKTTALYPNVPGSGTAYIVSLSDSTCGDTDPDRSIYLTGEVIVTCTLGDKFFLTVGVNGASTVMRIASIRLVFEQL